ncbi:LexA family transcriptional regulator [Microbulbifer sp. 2205BS26-8]|uniref:LexA family protein n=1 Tax=Microbulbifer sp. 2205BS26-8 TaxID=3064386 RepID=UPI00273DCD89|nr:S24 family peptidase [Microbulbifer sp. 2205BS26-8]MDP5211146.1 S24 family peptidase [Microbulbifer sp. 2205BS26-8]
MNNIKARLHLKCKPICQENLYVEQMNVIDRMKKVLVDEGIPTRRIRRQLAEDCGVSYEAVRQWDTRDTQKIEMDRIIRFADKWGVDIRWLTTGKGEREQFSNLRDEIGVNSDNLSIGPDIYGAVPLISSVQAGHWEEAIDNYQPGDGETTVLCTVPHSKYTFAVRVEGSSMEPKFTHGEIIIVDPEEDPKNGDYIIARRLDNQKVTFKQFISDSGEFFLKALNPQWPEPIIPIDAKWEICGVVISRLENFR